jgi:LmbE family N-acetylglucosaminyl deacetylase
MKKERVLAFGPHPDDVELQCAGTLALLAQKGYEIHIAVMAGGEMGSATLPPKKIHAIRMKEAAAAAAMLDGMFHFAGGHDIEVEYNQAYRRRAIRILREVDPFLVFTAPPADYMIDHEETSRLVRNACFIAPIPNYNCGQPTKPSTQVPYLYYWNAVGGCDILGHPLPLTCTVNISPVINIKTRILACHASQQAWLAHHHQDADYLATMRAAARQEGRRSGCTYAESFVQHRGSGYPHDNLLKSILGKACREYKTGHKG